MSEKKTTKLSNKDIKNLLAEMILENLETKNCILTPDMFKHIKQFNLETKQSYKGRNKLFLILLAEHYQYKDPRWGTFKQVNTAGGKIKKGSKGCVLRYINHLKTVKEKDENGDIILDDDGNPKLKTIYVAKPIINTFVVFNGEQMEDIPEYTAPTFVPDDFTKIADDFIASSKCSVMEKVSDTAHYTPAKDVITMPNRESFTTSDDFLHTLLHEMSHSTGHESRLNRIGINKAHINNKERAFEELIAEMSATFVMLDLELNVSNQTISNTVGYVSNWIELLKNKPDVIEEVCDIASHVANYLIKNYKEYLSTKTQVA